MKRMIKVLSALMLLVAMAAPVWAAEVEEPLQKDDLFQGTDQFSKNAKDVTEVNIDKKMMAMMGKFGGDDDKDLSNLTSKMDFVSVRSYEYEKPGQYKPADIEVFRQRLDGGDWSHVVKERSKDEQNDVWVRTDIQGQFSELVVISAEAAELTFVHLKGHMSVADLEHMGKKYGAPSITPGPKGAK